MGGKSNTQQWLRTPFIMQSQTLLEITVYIRSPGCLSFNKRYADTGPDTRLQAGFTQYVRKKIHIIETSRSGPEHLCDCQPGSIGNE